MSARMLERPCPHCGARDSLEVDASRGEIACSECAVVVLMGMEEDEGTRFAKDATMADADQDTRGGIDGAHTTKRSDTSGLDSRMTGLFRVLRERSAAPDAVVSEAAEMCRQFATKRRQRNARVEKPLTLAATCFHVASVFAHYPILIHEIVAYDRTQTAQQMTQRRADVLNELKLGEKYAQACQQERYVSDLLVLYLLRLKWNFQLFHDPVILVQRALSVLRVDRLTREDEVVVAILLLRLDNRVQQAVSKAVSQPNLPKEAQWSSGASGTASSLLVHAAQHNKVMDSLLETLAGATKYTASEMKAVYEQVGPHVPAILEQLSKLHPPLEQQNTSKSSPQDPPTQPAPTEPSRKREREE